MPRQQPHSAPGAFCSLPPRAGRRRESQNTNVARRRVRHRPGGALTLASQAGAPARLSRRTRLRARRLPRFSLLGSGASTGRGGGHPPAPPGRSPLFAPTSFGKGYASGYAALACRSGAPLLSPFGFGRPRSPLAVRTVSGCVRLHGSTLVRPRPTRAPPARLRPSLCARAACCHRRSPGLNGLRRR